MVVGSPYITILIGATTRRFPSVVRLGPYPRALVSVPYKYVCIHQYTLGVQEISIDLSEIDKIELED